MAIGESNMPIDTPPRAPSPVHGFGTLAVHAGVKQDPSTGAVIPPVSAIEPPKHQMRS
jgi:cystathionine gamma-lyase